MAVTIARTSWVDDDGSGTTGTVLNNAVKTSLYDQIDGALAQVLPLAGGTITSTVIHTAAADVGMGGASPVNPLHVQGRANNYAVRVVGAATSGQSYGPVLLAGTTSADQALSIMNQTAVTDYLTVRGDGNVGVGTSAPSARLHTVGTVRFAGIGSGNMSADASGNVTASDGRLKETVGPLPYGLAEVLALEPIVYKWKPESGYELEHEYAGFDARALAPAMPLAAPYVAQTDTHWLNDRAILGALVNAVRELAARIR